MSSADTKGLIGVAIERLTAEVPALGKLKLVLRLELPAHGGDAPIWRVELPGPIIQRDPAGDGRLDVVVQRRHFNKLASEGRLRDWAQAYERGAVKVTGDRAVIELLGNVIERQLTRASS